jgi:hypothetical protein
MKRNNIIEFQSKKTSNKETTISPYNRLLLLPKYSSRRRFILFNTETIGSSTTTTMAAGQSAPMNNSSNSSQSSRSSTATSSTSTTSPIILYKINSQANANANRTVLLLVLLLSFYVFCWAPYNIHAWLHAYQITSSSLSNDSNETVATKTSSTNNLSADLRRFIFLNYALYLLSMVSMCFSFVFYFSLNKHARREFSRFIGCICPRVIRRRSDQKKQKYPKQEKERSGRVQYRARFHNQSPYKTDRNNISPPTLRKNRYNYEERIKSPKPGTSQRTVLNYGCQIQCCT